jgi:hypothetical protein
MKRLSRPKKKAHAKKKERMRNPPWVSRFPVGNTKKEKQETGAQRAC